MTKNMDEQIKDISLLSDEVCLPVAVLYEARINNNVQWMQTFADMNKVKLAPHGKTTMTPSLFQKQIDAGAWAICVGTAAQAVSAQAAGVIRIIMANQLVGVGNMKLVASLIDDTEFYCLVDSHQNASALNEFFQSLNRSVNVLVELGVAGGRSGCRTTEQAIKLGEYVSSLSNVKLCGIEFYEGIIHGKNAVGNIGALIDNAVSVVQAIKGTYGFDQDSILLSGAGSVWYDIVADKFHKSYVDIDNLIPIIRPGCYITHDDGVYKKAQAELLGRNHVKAYPDGELQACLEVWAHVQSCPEDGLAIIAMGKRNVAFDAGYPVPKLHFRNGKAATNGSLKDWEVMDIMDHHAFLRIPNDVDLIPGDIIAFGTSHPCLTFDKWHEILMIDEQYNVRQSIRTAF